uniref:Protein kinase domain-containing protein n=1 Tax=Nelumbo nucifera TaxID=4432 RepID=A0A822Y822_NELNU|nr:TPA_asm: hypothetical protein HUJ06_027205 [Nelumbo nucifera]
MLSIHLYFANQLTCFHFLVTESGEELLRLHSHRHGHFHTSIKKFLMKHQNVISSFTPFITFLWFLFSLAIADLNSDRQALLDFVDAVPHGRKLNWNSSSPICSTWVGVTCSQDGTRVVALRLPGIGLSGPIPTNTLGRLDALRVLSLRSNRLSGSLPSDITSLPSLHHLFLQHNNLSDEIPASLTPELNLIDLSFNSFRGSIPLTVRDLTRLTGLNLQNNSFSGPIPDLNLPRLKHLNLSYNNLTGSIPPSLQKFPNSSFEGNPLLCGSPLSLCSSVIPSSSPSPSSSLLPPTVPTVHRNGSKKKLATGAIIAIAIGGSAVLFLLAIIILVCCLKRKDSEQGGVLKGKGSSGGRGEKPKEEFGSGVQEAEKNKLVFFEGCSFNFDLEDLLRASAEVLGKGSYGTAYKAVLEEGTTVVVKRLKEVVVGKKEFEQQMEIVGRVSQHPNVVPLRAYYYSKDEKLLVYDYIPAGNLLTLMHGMLYLTLIHFHF